MLGASWKTSVVGYLVILFTVFEQVYQETGPPSGIAGWSGFIGKLVIGVGLVLAKDADKTNAIDKSVSATHILDIPVVPVTK